MNTYIIKLKTECNKKKIRDRLNQFLRQDIFVSKYNSIQLKLVTNNKIIEIGQNYILDITKNNEVKNLREFIEIEYMNYESNNNDNDKITKLIFNYKKVSKKEYIESFK